MNNNIYHLDGAFEVEQRGDEFLFVDYENANWFRTNVTGKIFLDKCDGIKTVDEVMEDISISLGYPPNVLYEYMEKFIERAEERKLILKKGQEHECLSTDFSDYPNQLWIHVSNRCNMMCPFCYSSSNAGESYNLAVDEILSFVIQIPKDKRKEVVISGGEPFLYKEIVPLVKGLAELGFEITLITNGTVGQELYSEVVPYLTTLQISCDGTTPEYYEHTRGKGNFGRFLANLEYARKLGPKNLCISFPPNNYNISDIGAIPRFAYEHGVNHIHITRLTPAGRAAGNMPSIAPSYDDADEGIKSVAKELIEINNLIKTENEICDITGDNKKKYVTLSFARNVSKKVLYQTKITTCSLATGTLSIGYDGYIYPCGNFSSDEYRLGTIRDSIESVMERGKKFAFEHSVESPRMKDCFNCKFKFFCGSGCRVCALAEGDIFAADSYCERTKRQIMELMWNSEDMSVL